MEITNTVHKMMRILKCTLLLIVSVVAVIGVFELPPIAQPSAYHAFADQRTLWGMPHAFNVLSNIPLLAVGAYGLWQLRSTPQRLCTDLLAPHYRWFFGFVVITGVGSAYYHWAPTNATLVWDRLGITLSVMALFAALTGEFVSERAGQRLLWPLVVLGAASVAFWWTTEQLGRGDLRPYLLVQFLPLLITLLMLTLFRWKYSHQGYVSLLLLFYLIAKVCEHFDSEIYAWNWVVSGHTLKHLWAALTSYWVLWLLQHRKTRLITSNSKTQKIEKDVL